MTTTAAKRQTQPAPSAPPKVLGGVVAYLVVDGATRAAAFYRTAFAAEEVARHPVDDQGRTMHVHLHINGSSVLLSDAFPEHGHPLKPPQSFSLMMRVDDVEAWWERARSAGAEVVVPLQDMFWGDRYGELRDPFGVSWALVAPSR